MTPEEMIEMSEKTVNVSMYCNHDVQTNGYLLAIYWVLRAIKEDQVKGGR